MELGVMEHGVRMGMEMLAVGWGGCVVRDLWMGRYLASSLSFAPFLSHLGSSAHSRTHSLCRCLWVWVWKGVWRVWVELFYFSESSIGWVSNSSSALAFMHFVPIHASSALSGLQYSTALKTIPRRNTPIPSQPQPTNSAREKTKRKPLNYFNKKVVYSTKSYPSYSFPA
ncbi:uncharacterized protein K452DRAFT_71552 [Aplosporella prunicola CBS 121167]|uniref:Uncharacterized protein n=1 Tax=Aplosporella prunicola CBS 121167 TaxID=1176127 RepID=A0A6A6BVV8_9PEZI|nr:uncharacterized protein K452DRAFT_71552 [Aplosporella prunicola CBS 121167]KAF2146831.1 hypothetical protein K452DRAFT_71552 [Aplosporella prunicola CBS 121167]